MQNTLWDTAHLALLTLPRVTWRVLTLLLLSLPALAQVNAVLDRHQIDLNDSVRLSLEVTQPGPLQRPDFSVLDQDFRRIGSKKITISHRQGNRTRWQLLLRPKRAGTLTIPAIHAGAEHSSPVQLTVTRPDLSKNRALPTNRSKAATAITPASPSPATSPESLSQQPSPVASTPAFIENSLDYNETYEGSQLLYQVDLYHQQPLQRQDTLTEPFLAEALIIPLGEPHITQQQIAGQTYQRQRQHYAIFPDAPGQYQLPAPLFSASAANQQPWQTRGDALNIAVLPRANQTSQGYWLPARLLTLSEHFTPALATATEASAITRTLTLRAVGLPADRLPPLTSLQHPNAHIERIDLRLNDETSTQGITGSREEVIRITPYQAGTLTLAPIDIHWWDSQQDRAKIASLPARVIEVAAAKVATSPASGETETTPTHPIANYPPIRTQTDPPPTDSNTYPLLVISLSAISVLSLAGWLLTYRRLRRPARLTSTLAGSNANEQRLFDQLCQACRHNQGEQIAPRLVRWVQALAPHESINNSAAAVLYLDNATLRFLMLDLEQHLAGSQPLLWRGDLLLQALLTLRKRLLASNTKESP